MALIIDNETYSKYRKGYVWKYVWLRRKGFKEKIKICVGLAGCPLKAGICIFTYLWAGGFRCPRVLPTKLVPSLAIARTEWEARLFGLKHLPRGWTWSAGAAAPGTVTPCPRGRVATLNHAVGRPQPGEPHPWLMVDSCPIIIKSTDLEGSASF